MTRPSFLSSSSLLWSAALLGAVAVSACSRGDGSPDDQLGDCSSDDCTDSDSGTVQQGVHTGDVGPFRLRAEFEGPCEKKRGSIDVNLGNAPEQTVRALWCQITGEEPSAERVSEWSARLRDDGWIRRADLARNFCSEVARDCSLAYGDPWLAHEDLTATCERKTSRDMGAVLMFFGDCPGKVNCETSWSSTHAVGSSARHPLYEWSDEGSTEHGYYNPRNSGFWRRELLDARWAGLQFLMPNVYGPDLDPKTDTLPHLVEALGDVDGIQIALFDDTWIWGKGSPVGNLSGIWGPNVGAPWTSVPNFDDAPAAAKTLYESKWKPFFSAVPQDHWYLRDGKPFIYFYNAGTFGSKAVQSVAVLNEMKALFAADFGVEPFVVVDTAFFANGQNVAANGRFIWNSGACPNQNLFHCALTSSFEVAGTRIDHQMVRWDSLNRENRGAIASATDRIVKGPEDLTNYLTSSAEADVAVIATWNDLGEGTGIHRNYDYYYRGEWLEPNAFLSLIRESQCSN